MAITINKPIELKRTHCLFMVTDEVTGRYSYIAKDSTLTQNVTKAKLFDVDTAWKTIKDNPETPFSILICA